MGLVLSAGKDIRRAGAIGRVTGRAFIDIDRLADHHRRSGQEIAPKRDLYRNSIYSLGSDVPSLFLAIHEIRRVTFNTPIPRAEFGNIDRLSLGNEEPVHSYRCFAIGTAGLATA